MRKLIQIENEAGDRLYPEIHGDSIPNDAVTTEKVKDDSVTEPKLSTELGRKITGSKTVTDTLLRAFTEAKGDPYYLQDAFVRANLIPIPFEDEEVKRILLEHFDTDNDGEIWYNDIKDLKSNNNAPFQDYLCDNDKIVSFRELRFFDGLSSIGWEQVVAGRFMQNATNLKYIEFPKNIKAVGFNAFAKCTSLEEVILPDGVTNFGESAFGGCTNLKHIYLPDSIEELSYCLFNGDKNLLLDKLPSNLTAMKDYCFNNCKNITVSDIPASVTLIQRGPFDNCDKVTSLTFHSETPPTVSAKTDNNNGSFGINIKALYVPDDAVETYKTATNWIYYADIIKPVSEKPTN